MSVPVYARRFEDGDAAMLAYARAFHAYIETAKLDVSFVRAQLDGEWHVFALGTDAEPDQLTDGVPVSVPDAIAETLRVRRRQWAKVAGDVVLHHHPPLHVDLTQQP